MTSVSQVLTEARKYLGIRVGSTGHHNIVDTYNAHKPLALGYKVKYTDNWCDTFVSFVMIKLGATALTDTECGVQRHVALFSKLGIWIEDGTITPKPGDIIVYNWDDTTQPNDGFADHIGFVESVSGRTITTIEGNKGVPGTVARRQISVGNGVIRGYARPRYAWASASATVENAGAISASAAKLTVDGYWGPQLTRALQRLYGTTVDGIVSSQYNWKNAGLTSGWQFVLPASAVKGSLLIAAIQRALGVKADGKLGPDTIKAMQRKAGTPVDGVISAKSQLVMYMQRCVNAGKRPF